MTSAFSPFFFTSPNSTPIFRCSDDKPGYLSTVNGMTKSFLKSMMVASIGHQRKLGSRIGYFSSISAASASPLFSGQATKDTFGPKFYQDVLKAAREKFTHEISFQSKDKDISLAKVILMSNKAHSLLIP